LSHPARDNVIRAHKPTQTAARTLEHAVTAVSPTLDNCVIFASIDRSLPDPQPQTPTISGAVLMEQDPQRTITLEAANDNAPAVSVEKVDAAVMRLARLLGRQIAKDQVEAINAANDNEQESNG